MTTLANAAVINKAVSFMPPDTCYVNIGVWHGFSLLAGMAGNSDKTCIGVDNFSQFGGPREQFQAEFTKYKTDSDIFFDMDYRVFLKQRQSMPIGVYFYDAAHDYQNQLDGLALAEPFFVKGTIVMVDDTNWPDPYRATLNFVANSKAKYEILLDAKTAGNGHPTWWNGFMVLRRM